MQGEGVCCVVKRAVRGLLGSWDWGLGNGYACALQLCSSLQAHNTHPALSFMSYLIVIVNGDTMSTDAQVRCKGSGLTVLG